MALSNLPDLKSHVFVETPFDNLMQKRIGKVLIICSNYDFYMLEEDGRIDEIIFNEYVGLNLRYPPVFVHANTAAKAHRLLKNGSVDLVVVWLTAGSRASFEISLEIRNGHPQVPIVALTHYSYELSMHLVDEDFSAIDLIFHWNGDSNIFLAIIKIVEDRMNLENDVVNIGVQAILLVEDSIRYYSTYLPIIYRLIFKQSRAFMHEALNEHKRMLRMRGRPKILLARTYEEAEALYDEHKLNLLGVISDISYPRGGEKDDAAGFRLAQKIKRDDKYFPVLLQSSNFNNETRAKELKVGFLYKNSPTLSIELRGFINQYFAFGDFEFKDSRTRETVTTAADLKGLQLRLQEVSDDTLKYHIIRNHFSKWLKARALFGLADLFYTVHAEDFESTTQVRQFLTEAIVRYRKYRSSGIIAQFDRARYDEYVTFSRIGEGALGGKGRGLAFIDSFIKKHKLSTRFEGINISIPRTVVLSTSVYDEFMEKHQLMAHLSELTDDQEVLRVVVKQSLPEWVFADLRAFLASVKKPIAVRSSSVLEDSHYQPFAGIFSTYMIPHDGTNPEQTLRVLCDAIRSVYASAFFNTSKAYVKATAHSMDEGKMAIILQEVTGSAYDGVFFPQISGVARSINFYPIGHEKASDGIAHLGFGLGRITVGGGQTLRVSPAHPKHILQLSSPASSLRETQKHFFGLDLNPESFSISTDDGVNLRKLKITEAPQDALQSVASTYDLQNNIIRPGTQIKGKRLITFENILKYDSLPLAAIICELLRIGQKEISKPIEIEFAMNLSPAPGMPKVFSFLQIRPIVDNNVICDVIPEKINLSDTIVYCESALGNGHIDNIYHIVYVKPQAFDAGRSTEIVSSVAHINQLMGDAKLHFILIGPGRWGSSDPWLGIPVNWPQISNAKIIVEAGLKNYRIDPSQGTHFFQNLTSFNVGYFTINPFIGEGSYALDFLDAQEADFEDEFVRHIRFELPIEAKIDGKNNRGVIFRPGYKQTRTENESEDIPPEGFC